MKDDPEFALLAFLSADPAVAELVHTPPAAPRFYPDAAPQGTPRDLPCIVYEVLTRREEGVLAQGPHGLPDMVLLLECRAGTRVRANLLRSRVLESRGGNPDNRKLNGFAGSLGSGYVAQKIMAENQYYDHEPPLQAAGVGVYVAAVELRIWWNNP